ncbi:MAG: vWA domain-containing protein [Verrucomicrobiota bacterium]
MTNDALAKSPEDRLAALKAKSQSRVKELEEKLGHRLTSPRSAPTVFLLIDCSHSMDMNGPAKFEAAKRGAIRFCQEARDKNYLIGLISFAERGVCLREPSPYGDDIQSRVTSLTSGPYTNMADAISLATQKLESRKGQRAMCLVTDGQPFTKTGEDCDATLRTAVSAKGVGIEILAIGTDDADKSFLDKIVTSKELAIHVDREHLEAGISSMARLLPG